MNSNIVGEQSILRYVLAYPEQASSRDRHIRNRKPRFRQTSLYAYPPPALIPRVLHKVINERVYDMVLVTPLFPHASWWPTLLQVSTSIPVVLPLRYWITTDPTGSPSWFHRWPLVVWRISGYLQYARACRITTRRNTYGWKIRQRIRSVLAIGAEVKHEASLIMAATHDAGFWT